MAQQLRTNNNLPQFWTMTRNQLEHQHQSTQRSYGTTARTYTMSSLKHSCIRGVYANHFQQAQKCGMNKERVDENPLQFVMSNLYNGSKHKILH